MQLIWSASNACTTETQPAALKCFHWQPSKSDPNPFSVCVIQSGFSLKPFSNVTLAYYVCECVCERDRALFTASIQRRETTGSTLHPLHLLNEHRSDPSHIICVLHCPRLEGKNQGLKSQTEDGGRQRETILKPGRILFGIFLSFFTDFRPLRTLDEKC